MMQVSLRDIREDDLELIMTWRMSESVTKYMNTNPKLTLEDQKKWFYSLESRSDTRHWMIEDYSKPVGLIYLESIDWDKKITSWGYYIAEKTARSLKLAISLEMSLYDYVFEILNFKELHSQVFCLNDGVVKLHIACGSHIVNEVKGEVQKEGVKYDVVHMSISADEWKAIRHLKRYDKIAWENRNWRKK